MRLSQVWNPDDFLNAVLFVSIVGIAWFTIRPHFDIAFFTWQSGQPYGVLWHILNPLFANWQLYTVQVTAVQLPVVALQWVLVKKGKISKQIFVMTLFVTLMFRQMGTDQNVSVVMFAPFVELNPLFTLMVFLQKFPIGWILGDAHWQSFIGQITDPRFSQAEGGTFVIPYWVLIMWTIVPLMFWWLKRRREKKLKNCSHCACYAYEHGWCCHCKKYPDGELSEWRGNQ